MNRIHKAVLLALVFAHAAICAPATPIKHLVVIFPENISFDHYFGTYPHAKNPPGEPKFIGSPRTSVVNGLPYQVCERTP